MIAIPSFAGAATTEFRALFDYLPEAGCEVDGIDGVDLVLVTQVTEAEASMRVTRTHRQVCAGSILGAPQDIVTDGWDAGWNDTNKLLTLETRIPFAAFEPEMPSSVIAYFDATRNGSVHTSIANQDGSPIIIPSPPTRRRAIGFGEDRHITMDGQLADWGRIKPAVIGLASNGSPTLRLLRILAWPDNGDEHFYFAATAYLGSDYPYADDNMYLRNPGESLSIVAPGVLDNDAIPGGAPLAAQKVSDAARGTVTLNADGSFTYSPNHPQLLLDDEFEYKAVGGGKESNVARVIIQVNDGGNPNTPLDDAYTTPEDTTKVVPGPGVLENDPHTDLLVASLFSPPSHGTVVVNADGGFTYKPAKNFFGIDSFVYTAAKKQGAPEGIGGNATVTITVTPVNDAPVITPETFSIPENSPVNTVVGTVEASDEDDDLLSYFIVSGNTGGAFAINASTGQIRVANTAALDFETNPTFSLVIRVEDPSDEDTATITINLTDTNEPPVVVAGGTLTYTENDPPSVIDGALTVTDTDSAQLTGATVVISGNFVAGQDVLAFTPVGAITGGFAGNTLTLTGNDTPANYQLALRSVTYQNTSDNPSIASRTITWTATDGVFDSLPVTSTVNVVQVNDEPSFAILADPPASNEDAGPQTVNGFASSISYGPEESGQDPLTFTLTPTGTTGDLAFSAGPAIDASGNLTYTASANTNGTATFDVVLTDGGSNTPPNDNTSATLSFTITVNPVNDAPTFNLAGDQAVNEDSGPQTVNGFASSISVGPANESAQTITSFNVTNDNNALFVSQPAIDTSGNLTFQSAADANGSATVSVTATDSDGATSSPAQTFVITVNPINDEPSFAILADPAASNEDAGLQTVNGFASSISMGPADESGQTGTFSLTPTGTTGDLAFSSGPAIDPSGNLTYTASADTNGTASFDVVLTDSGSNVAPNDNTSATLSFTITVNAVNDPPTFNLAGDQTINEDAGPQTVNGFASSISVGPANESAQTVTAFNVTNDNNALFLTQPAIDTSGNLTYQANADLNGMATVSVTATDSGGATSSPAQTFTITVNAINDEPSFAILADPAASNEDAGLQTVNGFASSISMGPADESGQTGTFSVTPTGTTGDLAFSSGPAIDASGNLTYTASADTFGTASFDVVLTDSGSNTPPNDNTSATLSFTITVNGVNDPPTFNLAGNQSVNEDAGLQTVNGFASSISVGPANESTQTITSFNVTNDNNGLFSGQPAIDTSGNLTYTPAANAFGIATVSVTATDSDGATSSPAQTFTITVNAINDAPVVNAGGTLNYTENQAATAIDTGLTISDIDSATLAGATVQISANFASGEDVLSFADIGAITFVSYTGGTLTLTGTDTVANYQAALRTVAYNNTSDNPSTAARTITWQVNDGAGVFNLSAPVTSTVNVAAVNDSPTVAAVATLGYTEGDGAVVIDNALTLTDPDDTQMSGATIAITANYAVAEDFLAFTPVGSITGLFAAGTLTLSGTDTIANYQTALRSVTYQNTSANPSIASRTITWTVSDMAFAPGSDTTTINITPVNSAPVLTAGGTLNYTENDAATAIDNTVTVSDADTPTLASATVQITANYVNGEDLLSYAPALGITGSFNATNGTLTLTGAATPADWQTALRNVLYTNTSDDPSIAARTVTWQIDDGEAVDNLSNTPTSTINVAAVNDPPAVAADNLNYTEDAGPVIIDASVSVTDPDDANLTGATVVITGNCTPGEDVLAFASAFGVSFVSYVPATCTLTLTGSASPASYASALSSITYQNTSNHPSIAQRTVTWTVSDDQPSSGNDTSTIDVSRLNDAPTAVDDAGATNEDTVLNVVAAGVLTNDTDPDGGDTKTVTAVNGVGGNVGNPIVTGKGATVTLNANGSYSYDPTGSATIQALATGANDTDTFTYTMQDAAGAPSTATVTITLTGVNDAPTVAADNLLYTENDGPIAIDSTVSVGDVDDANLTGATVQITGNCTPGEDVLNFSNAFGVTFGSYNAASCTLTLTGTTTPANYAQALGTVTYENTSEHPSIAQRTVTWTVSDDEPSNGTDTSTIDVTRLNDTPTAVDDTNSVFANATLNVAADGVLANDTDPDTGDTKTVITVNGSGANVGVAIATTQGASLTLNADGSYDYDPTGSATLQALAAGATLDDTFTYTMQDAAAAASGTATVTITVTGVNDAPAGTNNTVTIDEDASYTFAAVDFGFTDPIDNPDDAFSAVVITTLPGTGTLTLSGNPVVAGQSIPVGSIPNLVYTPVGNGNGTPYTSFTFQVQDDGGTANGGVDLDPSANTFTVNVNNVNDAPAGTNNTVVTLEDTQYTFTTANFGFTDPVDTVPNALAGVVITTLPSVGSLTLSGNPVVATQEVSVADITAGNLRFTPAANGNGVPYTTFTFQVRDDGGTANGGVDLDPSANTMTIDVTSVNDAPAGTNNTVTTPEDTAYSFVAVDFGFTDPNDSPANAFASVVITTLPAAGSLTLSGNPVAAGQEIALANIPNLAFTGAANAFGSPYTTFTFQVRDDGGTANGGVNLDPSANTMTINVTPVNDAPVVVNDTFDVLGNTELRVDMVAGTTPNTTETVNDSGAYQGLIFNDSDIEGDTFTITAISGCAVADPTAPFDCTLVSGAVVHVEANGEFSFTPAPGATSGSFGYTVTDNGTTNAVSDPKSTSGTVTLTHQQMIWYVRQGASGNGTSISPFGNFDSLDGPGDSDDADDYIFVHHTGTALAATTTVPLEAGQHMLGEGVGLSIPVALNGNASPTVLVAAGTQPAVTLAAGDLFTIGTAIPVEIRGLALTATAANVVDLTTAAALTGSSTLTIANNTINGAGAEGIDINMNGGTTGTLALAITNNSWNTAGTHTSNAIDVLRGGGTLNLNVSNNTNVLSTGAAGISINGGNVANTFVTGFADNSVHGNTAGIGATITNVTFDSVAGGAINQVDGNNFFVGGLGNPVGGSGFQVTSSQGNLFFDDLDVFSAANTALQISGTGSGLTFAVTPNTSGGTSTIDADNGTGVDVSTAALDLRLSSLDSTVTTNVGNVSLNTVTGQFAAAAGALSKTAGTGTAFSVASSNAVIDMVPSLNVTSGSGVSLTSNTGSTMTFRGGMSISTGANAAFAATGGGTVNVCDESPCNAGATGALINTLTTTTATALNVANTTIGANTLEFRSISSNGGGSAGIVLNNTGANGLFVKGNGGACSTAVNCTGGAIQNKTVDGINLQTAKASFTRMFIDNNDNSGIWGDDVTDFVLADSVVSNNSDTTGGTEAGIRMTDMFGTASITNSSIINNLYDNVRMTPTTGTLTSLTVSGTTIGPNDATVGNNGFMFAGSGTSVATVNISGTTFNDNRASQLLLQHTGSGTLTSNVTANNFNNGNIMIDILPANSADMNIVVSGNTLIGADSNAINFSGASTSTNASDIKLKIHNNTVGNASVDSGSRDAYGIAVDAIGDIDMILEITSNVVQHTDFDGIFVESAFDDVDADAETAILDLTIRDNTVGTPDDNSAFPFGFTYGMRVEARHTSTLCMNMGGNTAGSVGGAEEVRVRQRNTATFRVERLTDGDATPNEVITNMATVEAHLVAENDPGTTVDATNQTAGVTGFTEAANGQCRTTGL